MTIVRTRGDQVNEHLYYLCCVITSFGVAHYYDPKTAWIVLVGNILGRLFVQLVWPKKEKTDGDASR